MICYLLCNLISFLFICHSKKINLWAETMGLRHFEKTNSSFCCVLEMFKSNANSKINYGVVANHSNNYEQLYQYLMITRKEFDLK